MSNLEIWHGGNRRDAMLRCTVQCKCQPVMSNGFEVSRFVQIVRRLFWLN
jgi:hypothetical protein